MNTTDSLTDAQIATLKAAALAATPQNIDSAQCIEHYDDGSHVACPACGGEGHVELEADFCNYDGTAIGVQFYGIGNAHGAAEAYLRAASPANVLALIERLERAEASLATTPQTDGATVALTEQQIQRIAHYCETEAHACPGTNMWQCAHMAIEETLRTLAETCLRLQIAEVCEDADGYKHIEAVIEDLDDLPKGTKLFAGAHAPAMADPVRVEQLRKGLFEARDAMRVMSNWVKQSDPAGHSWAVRMVDRANAVLSHAPAMAETVSVIADIKAILMDHRIDHLAIRLNDAMKRIDAYENRSAAASGGELG